MRRHLLGISALVFVVIWVVFLYNPPSNATGIEAGSSLRIGAVLAALWLAWPHLKCIPWWLYYSLLGLALIVAARPKMIVFALPALLAFWFLYWLSIPLAGAKSKAPKNKDKES